MGVGLAAGKRGFQLRAMSFRTRGWLVWLSACGLAACSSSPAPLHFSRKDFYAYRMISHEMGELDGQTYLSCLECFEKSYAAGQRYLEADLMLAADGKIVAMHDGEEERFGLPKHFTSEQFMSTKLLGKYSPLDGPAIAQLMKEKPDWYLVTDFKTDNRIGLNELCAELGANGIDCRERVLPEIFAEDQISITRALGFRNVILAVYKLPWGPEAVKTGAKFVAGNADVLALALPVTLWNAYGHDLLGDDPPVPVYVHTVDDPDAERNLFDEGVTGLYSDSLRPATR